MTKQKLRPAVVMRRSSGDVESTTVRLGFAVVNPANSARSCLVFALIVLALAASTIVFTPAAAQGAELPPGGTFTDDNELAEEGWIEAIAAIGVTLGCNPPANTKFCPDGTVTREQMASFLVRALDLPATKVDYFIDDEDSVHQDDINAIAEVGITLGCNPPDNDQYCPGSKVKRGQMAAFLNRAFAYPAAEEADFFTDDDESEFETDIDAIAAEQITFGCGGGNYCPTEPMLRRHMAVFLGRSLQLTPMVPPPVPKVIGQFTTYYGCCVNRAFNIQLMSRTVDGTVVQPGEVYSLNGQVGLRTEAKGYKRAGAIIGGKLVCCDHWLNVGGGVSQFSTTLYNAIFFAGLEDVEHRPHSIYFTRYPMGREATVAWPGPDVKFKNDTQYPLTIDTSYTSTSITVKIIGANGNRKVKALRSGSATTASGGTVTITRVITFADGSQETERWTWRYNPKPPAPGGGSSGGGGGSDDDDGYCPRAFC
ncbi:MAG: VanW family protein [Acidobacteria bacterium]|nr:VanW family protein [Acidobacteriota bacterium]